MTGTRNSATSGQVVATVATDREWTRRSAECCGRNDRIGLRSPQRLGRPVSDFAEEANDGRVA